MSGWFRLPGFSHNYLTMPNKFQHVPNALLAHLRLLFCCVCKIRSHIIKLSYTTQYCTKRASNAYSAHCRATFVGLSFRNCVSLPVALPSHAFFESSRKFWVRLPSSEGCNKPQLRTCNRVWHGCWTAKNGRRRDHICTAFYVFCCCCFVIGIFLAGSCSNRVVLVFDCDFNLSLAWHVGMLEALNYTLLERKKGWPLPGWCAHGKCFVEHYSSSQTEVGDFRVVRFVQFTGGTTETTVEHSWWDGMFDISRLFIFIWFSCVQL